MVLRLRIRANRYRVGKELLLYHLFRARVVISEFLSVYYLTMGRYFRNRYLYIIFVGNWYRVRDLIHIFMLLLLRVTFARFVPVLGKVKRLIRNRIRMESDRIQFIRDAMVVTRRITGALINFQRNLRIRVNGRTISPLLNMFFLISIGMIRGSIRRHVRFVLLIRNRLLWCLVNLFRIFLLCRRINLRRSRFAINEIISRLRRRLNFFFFS